MARLKIHSPRNAPEAVRPMLEMWRKGRGGVPSLAGVTAGSPLVHLAINDIYRRLQGMSLEPEEKELVLLTACKEYGNEYALEFQSYMAGVAGLPEHVIDAVHEQRSADRPWEDERYNALWVFVAAIAASGGKVKDSDIKAFRKSGFSDAQMLEVTFATQFGSLLAHLAELAQLNPDRKFRWSSGGLFSRGR